MGESETTSDPSGEILHVAESFAGGVLAAVLDYVQATPTLIHHLLYAERADAPMEKGALGIFATADKLPSGHLRRVMAVRDRVLGLRPRVIHAHSSFAGAYVRTAVRSSEWPIIYTPHCYSFERGDIGRIKRGVFRALEFGLAANTSIFAACSPREQNLSKWPWSDARVVLLPNIPPGGSISRSAWRSQNNSRSTLTIVGAGRPSAQKDPGFFLRSVAAAASSGLDVKPVWIGGDPGFGSEGDRLGVEVTGWLPRAEGLAVMASADIYLHTGLWEGFPLAVLEATSLGVPTIVRDVAAFEDLDLVKVKSEQDFVELLSGLPISVASQDIWQQSVNALAHFTSSTQSSVLENIYGERP